MWAVKGHTWQEVTSVSACASLTKDALDISKEELLIDFVSTWTDEELETTDPAWIEYATVEMMRRLI